MEPHILPPAILALPANYAYVEGILRNYDPALRLRKSIDQPHMYVLERRLSRSVTAGTSRRDGSDLQLQASEGYIHVGLVHPSYLAHPDRILQQLKASDSWAAGGANAMAAAYEADEWYRDEEQRRKRKEWFRDIAKESFDILDRVGGIGGTERMRFNNPGIPEVPAAPDPPAAPPAAAEPVATAATP